MRFRFLFSAMLVTGLAFSQDRSSRPSFGYGSILNPGGVNPAPIRVPSNGSTHAGNLGASISGRPIPGVTGNGNGGRGGGYRGGGGAVYVPYAYPVAYPVYVQDQYPPQQLQQQVYAQPSPSVIINNNYMPETASKPVIREYSAESLPQPLGQQKQSQSTAEDTEPTGEAKPVVYLLAMKDGSIYSAVAYWIEDSTLHYITPRHDHNRASLDLVDREITDQVNRERKVPFRLSSR